MKTLVGLVSVVVLLASCSPASENQETWSVAGSISVPAIATDGTFGTDEAGDSCELADEFEGVLPNLQNTRVRITDSSGQKLYDSSGRPLTTALLTRGELAFGYEGSWQGHDTIIGSTGLLIKQAWDRCIYGFRIDGLPLDRDEYFISVAGLDPKKLELAEDGDTRVDLTLYMSRGGDVVAVSEGPRDKLAPVITVRY